MWLFQLRWTRKCYRKKIIYGYRLLLEIKIPALSLWWKKKRKVLCAGKGQVQAYNGSFCQLSFVSTKCYIPFTGDEYCSCLQTDPGWLGVDCRHFKVILLYLCLCFSSAYFQFAVVLGKRFDSWFKMCTPRRFQEAFRQRDKACLFMLLCSMCSVAIIHTPHCAQIPGYESQSNSYLADLVTRSAVPWGSKPLQHCLSHPFSLFPTLYMLLRKKKKKRRRKWNCNEKVSCKQHAWHSGL